MNNLDSIRVKTASYQKMGDVLAKEGRVDEAIAAYQEAVQLQPDAEIYFQLGSLLTLSGRINEAIAAYQQAVQLQPDYVDPYWNLAWLFSQQNKWDEAITCEQKACALKPQGVWEHFQKNSYKFIKLHSLSEEDRIFIENIGVSIANLELINQSNISAKKSYQDVWSYSPEMPISKFGITSSLHSIVDKGYVELICPVSGQILKSNQSFYVDHYPYMIFYRFLGSELFYLVVGGNWVRFNIAIYFPFKDLIISFCEPTNGIMMEAAPVDYWVNIFKSYTLSCLNDVKYYLLNDRPKKKAAVLGIWNIGHYFWNEISAIQELYETKKLNKVDAYVIGPCNYLDIQDVFPEIRAEKSNVEFFYFQAAKAPYWYLQAELPQPTAFKFCLTNNYFTFKLTALAIQEKLANRIYHNSYNKCSPIFLQKVAQSKKHFPLLWISIRSQTREWISQVEGIANIIKKLSDDFPSMGVIFDGMPTEKANMEKILELIPPNISTYNALGCEVHETFVWVHAIDLFIMGYGAGSVFPWIANKIGIYHGSTHMAYYDEPFCLHPRENAQYTFFVTKDAITEDVDSVSDHPHTRNYDIDWKAIYNEVVKIIDNLNEERTLTK